MARNRGRTRVIKMEDYGDSIASTFDESYPAISERDPEITFLAKLAGDGPALELGIGTGRIALPLAKRGVSVEGVDVSARMVRELRKKPGGREIPVHLCSMSRIRLRKRFRLIFSVFNTFFSLTTRAEQEECFERAARHLSPGGAFLLQTFYPNLRLFSRDQRVNIGDLSRDHAVLDLHKLDRAEQRVTTFRLIFGRETYRMIPIQVRFSWPRELDQMASKAGLRLQGRWDGWKNERFTANPKGYYVSVWRAS